MHSIKKITIAWKIGGTVSAFLTSALEGDWSTSSPGRPITRKAPSMPTAHGAGWTPQADPLFSRRPVRRLATTLTVLFQQDIWKGIYINSYNFTQMTKDVPRLNQLSITPYRYIGSGGMAPRIHNLSTR